MAMDPRRGERNVNQNDEDGRRESMEPWRPPGQLKRTTSTTESLSRRTTKEFRREFLVQSIREDELGDIHGEIERLKTMISTPNL